MEKVYVRRMLEVKKNKRELERVLNVKLRILGRYAEIFGSSLDEYDALQVFDAINFGFSARKALMLRQEDFVFKIIHIKEHTHRSLRAVKARLIGTHGKTRKTMSLIAGCEILIKEGEVGVVGYVEDVENTERAVVNLIKGSKQGNMYKYLERMNRLKKESAFDPL